MNKITDLLEPMVLAMEELAEGDMGDRIARAMAKMSSKCYQAFIDEGFGHDEAILFTKVLLKKTSIEGGG